MTNDNQPSYQPGHQPYDAMNALRIGALLGGVLGIVLLALVGVSQPWLIIVTAVIGAIGGYTWHVVVERSDPPDESFD